MSVSRKHESEITRPTHSTIAAIHGVGTVYFIEVDTNPAINNDYGYRVRVTSGPVEEIEAENLSWEEAMDHVRDEITCDLEENK